MAYWQSFFDTDGTLETLFSAGTVAGDLLEFGCGYGTFTLPAARRTRGLDSGTQAHSMIFKLRHLEQPLALLREAHRVLRDGGVLSVMHWRSDIPTPHGPSLDIRPRPEECQSWLQAAGVLNIELVNVQPFCPYHFALVATR